MELQKPYYNELDKSQMLNIKVADKEEEKCLNPHHTPTQWHLPMYFLTLWTWLLYVSHVGLPDGASVPMQEMWEIRVQSLGWEDPLEEGTATHSSIHAWRIP